MSTSWRNLPTLALRLEFEVRDSFRLPPFAGSMFRGCLGWALQPLCTPAEYELLFETSDGKQDIPRPFVLVPPAQDRNLKPGDRIRLALRLFGPGCQHADKFLEAFAQIGQVGIGQSQCRYDIVRVLADEGPHSWVCFDPQSARSNYLPLPCALGRFALTDWSDIRAIEIEFTTPTRLVHRGEPLRQVDYPALVSAAIRRVESFTGRGATGLDYRLEMALAQHTQTTPIELHWGDWERTSNRQGRRVTMGGLLGKIRVEGQLNPDMLSLLQAAQLLHLGKGTTFGMGETTVRRLTQQTNLPPPPQLLRRVKPQALDHHQPIGI